MLPCGGERGERATCGEGARRDDSRRGKSSRRALFLERCNSGVRMGDVFKARSCSPTRGFLERGGGREACVAGGIAGRVVMVELELSRDESGPREPQASRDKG